MPESPDAAMDSAEYAEGAHPRTLALSLFGTIVLCSWFVLLLMCAAVVAFFEHKVKPANLATGSGMVRGRGKNRTSS